MSASLPCRADGAGLQPRCFRPPVVLTLAVPEGSLGERAPLGSFLVLPEANLVMSRFSVHWSVLPPGLTPGLAAQGARVVAVWPAPVNDDQCFRRAGFGDFGDADAWWDAQAERLVLGVVEELSRFGTPQLRSAPRVRRRSWWKRRTGKEPGTDVLDEIWAPVRWDHLPDAVVGFGDAPVSLRTGRGHLILWLTLPGASVDRFVEAIPRIACSHPVSRTDLRWEHLLPAAPEQHGSGGAPHA